MRGGISLAAAVAIPPLTFMVDNLDLRDLFIFIVFSIIFLTLVLQGLSLPILIKKFRLDKVGDSERYKEHISELQARVQMLNAALHWLRQYREDIKDDKKLLNEASMHIYEYQMLKKQFEIRIFAHKKTKSIHDEKAELQEHLSLLYKIYEIEKTTLEALWEENRINLKTRNKLALLLDHQIQRNVI
jgi:CPA1 family monovalent cation:H+ antiporter